MAIIIGLSGYSQSGKDTVATFLKPHGFARMAFADKVRDALYALNPVIGLSRTTKGPIRVAELVDGSGWDATKKTPEVRLLLQRLGTEVGREILGQNVWVQAVFSAMNLSDEHRYVITDVRFTNEALAIQEQGGKLWRIDRPSTGPATAPDGSVHRSETELDDWKFDVRITNDGSLTDLKGRVRTLIETFYNKEAGL